MLGELVKVALLLLLTEISLRKPAWGSGQWIFSAYVYTLNGEHVWYKKCRSHTRSHRSPLNSHGWWPWTSGPSACTSLNADIAGMEPPWSVYTVAWTQSFLNANSQFLGWIVGLWRPSTLPSFLHSSPLPPPFCQGFQLVVYIEGSRIGRWAIGQFLSIFN